MDQPPLKLAYVSGKYTDSRGPAFAELNINKAAHVAMQLWSMGIPCICPHANTKHFDGVVDYETFMAGDILMVDRCNLVVMVDNWHSSAGAKQERQRAINKLIPVFEWPEDGCRIVLHCWPYGMSAKYVASCKNTLPEDLYERIRNEFCCPSLPPLGSVQQ
jgi:hypothetical protein